MLYVYIYIRPNRNNNRQPVRMIRVFRLSMSYSKNDFERSFIDLS